MPKPLVLVGDARDRLKNLPAESVNCCITSPPYWQLRDYGVARQLGVEDSPDEYVESMVEVFREVKRVLKGDGTLWLNLGDIYMSSWPTSRLKAAGFPWASARPGQPKKRNGMGLKPKDLVGIPWGVALALQADGWYLRWLLDKSRIYC